MTDFVHRVRELEEKEFWPAAVQHRGWWRKAQGAWRAATSYQFHTGSMSPVDMSGPVGGEAEGGNIPNQLASWCQPSTWALTT